MSPVVHFGRFAPHGNDALRLPCRSGSGSSEAAEKELSRLPPKLCDRIERRLLLPEDSPFPSGAKRLQGNDRFRLRVGDYRILYEINHGKQVIEIVAIGHRKEVYR